MIQKILKDLENKLNISINDNDIHYFSDGESGSTVFRLKEKYLVKTIDKIELETFKVFFSYYNNEYFQKIVCYNKNLLYICFEYIEGDRFKNSKNKMPKEIVKEIYKIVSTYKLYDNEKYGYLFEESESWEKFLLEEAYKEKYKDIVDFSKLFKAFEILKKYECPKYLIHGDFGTHNFIVNNGNIKVIDPMPVVGDYLYDFYCSIFTNTSIFKKLDIDYILSFFDREYEYKKALMTVCIFVRIVRAIKYDPEEVKIYLNYIKKI